MSKLKQLLPHDRDAVQIECPVCDNEILDRHLQYNLLSPISFAKRFHDKLYAPTHFTLNENTYSIQYNHCTNPFCESFGMPQKGTLQLKTSPIDTN